MKEVAGDRMASRWTPAPAGCWPGAIRLVRALEPFNVLSVEDLLSGDYRPWVNSGLYRELTRTQQHPIQTGKQIYLRQNYKKLIESDAVHVVGPDPADVGGIAELKWIAEHADLHGITIAPHGTANGLLGLGALV
jgi:L-alanine-DL-glutamate epimerase-like enolase superfamily enzyme